MAKRRRKRRRLPEQLETVNLRAAGIDVGNTDHWVAIPPELSDQSVRRFGTMTPDLRALADWLSACGIETIAMESTGVYWIPLFELLDQRGFEVLLVNPRHLKSVPGRKSDVMDCQWIQRLHTFGLLSAAFRPDDQTCVLRGYLRHREMLVKCAGIHIQHMQKALSQMNIKLQNVVSDITCKTGLRIMRAIIAGERDPAALAEMRDPRCRKSAAEIARALEGNWRQEHLFALQQALELFDLYYEKIAECDHEIEIYLDDFDDRSGGRDLPKKKRAHKTRGALAFDGRKKLFEMVGVDLTLIPGIEENTVLTILSEIGTDVSKWPSAREFAAWATLAPGSKITGGKKLSSKTVKSTNRTAQALRMSANGLHNSPTAIGAFLRRKKAQIGPAKAITATAHKLARILYTMIKNQTEYTELGEDTYERQHRKRAVRSLKQRAKRLGFQIIEIPSPQVLPA